MCHRDDTMTLLLCNSRNYGREPRNFVVTLFSKFDLFSDVRRGSRPFRSACYGSLLAPSILRIAAVYRTALLLDVSRHSRVMNSSRFISTRATAVHAVFGSALRFASRYASTRSASAVRRLAGEADAERERDLARVVGRAFLLDPLAEAVGEFDEHRVVRQVQRLQRRVAAVAASCRRPARRPRRTSSAAGAGSAAR